MNNLSLLTQGVDPISRERIGTLKKYYIYISELFCTTAVEATCAVSCRVDRKGRQVLASLRCTERGESIEAEDHSAFEI